MKEKIEWAKLSPEEKKIQLYLNQKDTLNLFLQKNAISKKQYIICLEKLQQEKVLFNTNQ